MDSKPEDRRGPRQSTQCPSAVTPRAENLITAAELVMTRRRSLLKAAASVAPVLATLPNGAALANASAFQCANNQLDEANLGLPDGAISGTPSSGTPGVGTDQYYRVAGKQWNVGEATLYNFTAFNGDIVTVTSRGRRITRPNLATPPAQGAIDVQLLVFYEPILDDGLVIDLPANQDGLPVSGTESPGCIIEQRNWPGWDTDPTAPDYCIFPIAKVGPQSGSTNIGMTASCLTSFATAPH